MVMFTCSEGDGCQITKDPLHTGKGTRIIVKMLTTLWHSHLQSGRIHQCQWWSYVLFVIRCDVHCLEYLELNQGRDLFQYINNGSNDLIMMIVVDKTEHDIHKVTFTAYSSNNHDNGDISTFIFCRAYCIIGIKQWESKRIIRTLLLQPWLWVTYQNAHIHLKTGNNITKREWKPPIDSYTNWALELGHGYSPLTSWGRDLFPTPSFISLSENLSKTIGGKLVGFSSVKDVDLIQCNLKSV